MADPISDSELAKLNYTREWLKHGFVTEARIRQELREAESDVEWNLDHYRGAALSDWIHARTKLADEELEHLLWLLQADPDLESIIVNGLIGLNSVLSLTTTQVDQLEARLGPTWANTVSRWRARLRIRSEPWSPESLELFLEVLTGPQLSRLLAELIDRRALGPNDLQQMAERGQSKRVRHEATMALKRVRR
ncbi:MAG: hypothetical protein ACFCBV_01110 [Phycisphaerales bacterium]